MQLYVFWRQDAVVGIEMFKQLVLGSLDTLPIYHGCFLGGLNSSSGVVQWIWHMTVNEYPAENATYFQMSLEQVLYYCSVQEKINKLPSDRVRDFLIKEFI